MKNYTLRSLYLTMLVVLFAATPRNVQAQCATTTVPGVPASLTLTSTWQTLTTQSGRYYTFSATAGCVYTFSHCQGGGNAPAGFNQALTITDGANVIVGPTVGPFCVTGGSEIVWTCPTTGTYRVHHEKFPCGTGGPVQTAVMAYKAECPCAPGVALATPNSVCFGANTVLTLSGQSAGATFQWQESDDNVIFTNIPTATVSPYTYGPLSATKFFRAVVTCTGVGNTVGTVNTAAVQVTVNQLPAVNWTGQVAPNCCNDVPFILNNALPANGVYSGAGVTLTGPNQYTFTPSAVCGTTANITYTVTDGNNCSGSVTLPYVVNDTTPVTFGLIPDYCFGNCGSFALTQATPAGGTYGDFTPNNFVFNGNIIPCGADGPLPTVNYVSYTYLNNITGCLSHINQTVNINPTPNVTLAPAGPFCLNAPDVQLVGNPGGGVYTDPNFGNVTTTGLFSPATIGIHDIDYVWTDGNGCAGLAELPITVSAFPAITWALPYPVLCENSPVLNLNGYGQPGGGTYSSNDCGTCVTANQFNPAGQSANSPIDIIYTVTSGGCTSQDSQTITVLQPPVVTFVNGPVPAVCLNSAPFSLTPYVTPAGGTWSSVPNNGSVNTGTGMFTPSIAGTYTITYTFVQGTCQNTTTFQVVVNPLPNVNLPAALTTHCITAPDVILTNVGTTNPPGGTRVYSGPGVSFNGTDWVFDPSIGSTSVPDTFLITLTYTDPNGCSNFDTASIFTTPQALVNFPPLADVCDNGADVLLQATPAGGTFSGSFVTGGAPQYFQPGPAPVGNYWITYIGPALGGCPDTGFQNIIVKPITGPITVCSSVNPTTCGATNGSFCICGLAANTTYVLTYLRNGVLQGPFTVTSNGSGQYCRMNLNAAAYTQITMALNGCPQLNNNVFVTLVDPNAPPAPTAGSNSPLCQFSTLQLTATTSVINGSFNWAGPNSFFSNQQNPSILNVQPIASGPYTVTVTNNQNCTSLPGTVNVVVNPAPNLTVGSNSPVCAGSTLNLTAGSTTPGTTFQWTGPGGFFSILANPTIANTTPANAGWYYVMATGTNSCTRTDSVLVVIGTVTPTTPTADGPSPICSGTTLNLTATNSTGGSVYSWTGPGGWTANTQNPSRANIQLVDEGNYVVMAILNGCQSATSSVFIDVVQSLTPTITITPNPDDTVCFGTNIEFTSVITDGGTSPIYQWYINGVPVIGAIDSFWGSPYLTDLDTVTAVLTNSTSCTTASSDTSNKVTIHMSPNTIPTVDITSNPLVYVAGAPMDFTATVLNGGTNPTYQWFLNGTILPGETNMVFSSSTLTDQDILTVLVTSNAPCAIPDTASDFWNALINVSVTAGGKVVENMQLFPNPNNGTFILSGNFNGMTGVKDAKIEALNTVGQVVYKDNAQVVNGKLEKQMKMADVAAGVYMLRITADGRTVQMKFVVNK